MSMIEFNRHPAGPTYNAIFGLCQIADGLVRLLSLGHLHTRLTLEWSKWQAKRHINSLRRRTP